MSCWFVPGAALRMDLLFSLLVLMLLPRPTWLYSLHNCTLDPDDPQRVYCRDPMLTTIPSDIPKSASYLSVSWGRLQTIQKSNFTGFNKLQALYLHQNLISHVQDGAFSDLSVLTELCLTKNQLTTLTDDMFDGLFDLTVLLLGQNKINHISQFAFVPLGKLQKVDLSKNLLSSPGDMVNIASFSPLLEEVDLSYNALGLFENPLFPLNLTNLSLSSNPLRSFRLRSDTFPRLQALYLSSIDSELQWDVSDKAFLKSLRTLDLTVSDFKMKTYELIFQSVDMLENLILRSVGHLDRELLESACKILSLQELRLNLNTISDFPSSFLQSCSQLTRLDLSQNYLTDSSPLALGMLTRLSKLNIGSNLLTRVPPIVRNLSSLTGLSLGSNRIRQIQCLDFSNLSLLTELNLSDNKLRELNGCVFQGLQSLQRLNIQYNPIRRLNGTFDAGLPNLLVLSARGNKIGRLQTGLFKNMSRLTELELDSEVGAFVVKGAFDGLTELRSLSCSPRIHDPPTNFTQHKQFFNLPSLQKLTFSVSGCFSFPQDFLAGLDNLQVFSSTQFYCLSQKAETFRHTPNLLNLALKDNQVWSPYPELFQPISALQTLDLSKNKLQLLDFLLEANLTNLQTLILSNNELSVINETVLEALPSLQYLDLTENPFACNCSNADFIYWTIFNRQVYVNDAFWYKCASPPSHVGLFLLDFNLRSCWESVGFLCFVSSSALVLLTLLCCFVHHFLRFSLLYTFYLLRAFLFHRQKQRRGCAQAYDAFVSYNVHDEEWVYRELVPELEERQGWKLCLHHRDFQPGKAILENITDAIYSSRKTLCVISQQYLHSEWCSREIQMASFRLLDEKKDVLVLLFLEELSSNQLSPFFRMRKLLRSRTYVSWTGARGHSRGLFWERVRHALQSGAELPAGALLPADQ